VSATSPHVLIVEDEAPIRAFLRTTLRANGYRCSEAATAQQGLLQVTADPPEVVLLDLGLPDGDGLDLARTIRQWSAMPIIVLSARGQEQDKVRALDLGADDYLTKPFGVPELLARIRVSLRHAASAGTAPATVHSWGERNGPGFTVDLTRRLVLRHNSAGNDEELRLTPTEFRLLAELTKQAGKVRTHAELLRAVWGPANEYDVAYLRVYVGQIRHKLEPEPSRPRWFLTEPGVGYRLVEPNLAV
jgi:two-component system, OmpR family, KDP operon response regulator KdpE